MEANFKFNSLDPTAAISYAKEIAGEKYSNELETVLRVALLDKQRLPKLRFKADTEIDLKSYITKWVTAYLGGYEKRPSKRKGGKSSTNRDPAFKVVLRSKLSHLTQNEADRIEAGHAVMMTIENLVGELLEEFLSEKLLPFGWFCCWGSTIDAVDFCKADGSLLQVKNSDNSENSSSGRVRAGTKIEKWQRRNAFKENEFYWETLNTMVPGLKLTEEDFRAFITQVLTANPDALYIDKDHILNAVQAV